MTVWRSHHGRKLATRHTLKILDDIEARLASFGDPRPKVASIRIGAGLNDEYEFEVELELAPGAILAVRYQSVDEEDPSPVKSEAGSVAYLVASCIDELAKTGFGAIADRLHALRVQARRTFAAWRLEGAHVQLADIRAVATEHWIGWDGLEAEIRYTSLDNRLRPSLARIELSDPDKLDAVLEAARPGIVGMFQRQTALYACGADGLVDHLVLGAMAMLGADVPTALRAISAGWVDASSPALTVFGTSGHVQCHGHDPAKPEFGWNRDSVIIKGLSAPATALLALTGRPITDLVQHPLLSEDMIITEATARIDFGFHSVRAAFTQPRWLFCGASGRTWLPEEGWRLPDIGGLAGA